MCRTRDRRVKTRARIRVSGSRHPSQRQPTSESAACQPLPLSRVRRRAAHTSRSVALQPASRDVARESRCRHVALQTRCDTSRSVASARLRAARVRRLCGRLRLITRKPARHPASVRDIRVRLRRVTWSPPRGGQRDQGEAVRAAAGKQRAVHLGTAARLNGNWMATCALPDSHAGDGRLR